MPVTQNESGTFDFVCDRTDGSCAPFASTGWPSAEVAAARGAEHEAEHADGTAMTALHEFREAHGVTA